MNGYACESCRAEAAFILVTEALCSVRFTYACTEDLRAWLEEPHAGADSVIQLRGDDWGDELTLAQARRL